ncbi:NDP-hexose 2,3-dehydratase family protein [Weissella diestrammenae]|uniref:NDP-hexose 2,3-dehydratase family protein n=1 Tax=Weissella diestrammenae TaxID=1162633 RepID=A0A7G9T522_9LACO|nr:NDP-hexose 2,3-dehydratase family protein [Weissella diestrammenae]MCM0582920.1 NDP-hexose 2,3-dehydratase family protein [Weissella diestrammenae]QNN75197.1 NDP-hexose 2,3-dehydratase family protein [Weissella diestrammenae]
MTEKLTQDILRSWQCEEGNVNSYQDILNWITDRNKKTTVEVNPITLDQSNSWYHDQKNGYITNVNHGFFQISGIQLFEDQELVKEQPIILQTEIGFLGMIIKKVDGVLNFLMQAKIEPGNINAVQLSPTIQATKSNFTAKHGGKKPAYLDYFLNSENYQVLYDQIQSEQSGRFYKKRNRNMIVFVEDEIELLPNFKWMTLGQIKKMLDEPNLINMDTRTVISGIPFQTRHYSDKDLELLSETFTDISMFNSIFISEPSDYLPQITKKINDYKMFTNCWTRIVPISEMKSWRLNQNGIKSYTSDNFSVGYFEVAIEGREITSWTQPLIVAEGIAELGLILRNHHGTKEILIKLTPEIGTMDAIELGPTIQWESLERGEAHNNVEKLYLDNLEHNDRILRHVMLSEEGGRFYHEQNLNVIMEIGNDDLQSLPENYIWVSYSALNYLIQSNNVLNIQLRNLLSMLMI